MDKWLERNTTVTSASAIEIADSSSVVKFNLSENKRKRNKFNRNWTDIPEFKTWIEKSKKTKNGNEMAYCKLCQCDINAHRNDIQRHSNSIKHKFHARQVENTKKISCLFNNPLDDKIRRAEIKLSGLLAVKNLPFSLMDLLSPLCGDLFTDSEIAKQLSSRRTKATHILKYSLGRVIKEEFYSKIAEVGCFFSIIVDETTDQSSVKQCAFTVIYFCETTNKVKTKFFDMVELASATAENLYNCLKEVIVSKNIPLSNLVGYSSDTTNCMFGEHVSVNAFLKQEFPHIVSIKCSCHMIHLCASKACLQLPRSVEDLLRFLGSHFSRSYLRQEKLREFQQFFQIAIHKIFKPAVTRWLSLKECVDRVLEQFDPLTAYLRQTVFDAEDHSKLTKDMLEVMENKFTKLYLEFMSYVLGLLVDFNVLFQSESPLLYKLMPETEKLLKNLCSNFIDMKHIKDKRKDIFQLNHRNPEYFVPIEKLYLGIGASESFQELKKLNVPKTEVQQFLLTCLNFYLELVTQIKTKFVFNDPVFDLISIVDPAVAQSFEIKSLNNVLERFPTLKSVLKSQDLDNEWRNHALLDHDHYGLKCSLPVEQYWSNVFMIKNPVGDLLFPNLKKMMSLLLVLPFSNASVERVFSELNNIKTESRNKLGTETICSLIITKQDIAEKGGLLSFNPNTKMLKTNIWRKPD